MTEAQKHLRKHFLESEMRCGHYVSAETKAQWMAMLDMVEVVDRICRKHGIKYFLIAGSLLGAIRHRGFIPWDDDIDIALFRDDYDKLERILPKELPSNMFMQTLATDPGYITPHIKIRLDGTAAIQDFAINSRYCYNMGVFIDVFALDGFPETKIGVKITTKLIQRWKDFIRYHNVGIGLKRKREWVKKILYGAIWGLLGPKMLHRLREWTSARFRVRPNGVCIQCPCAWGYAQRYRYDVADFAKTVDVPFEYLTLKVPANYEKVLTDTYGDWHKVVKGDSTHMVVDVSVDTDYKTILAEKYGYSAQMLAKCSSCNHNDK